MSDNIFGRSSHVAGNKGSSRVQSQARMSTDWRKRAAAISSPGPAAQRSDPSYDENDQLCVRLDFERSDTSFSAPQYRYPKGKKARWEAVLSAPTWQTPSSSSSACGEAGPDVTRVQLRSVNPITTNVNGEDIPLADRFCFDVVPIGGHQIIAGIKFAELRPLDGSITYRASSSGSTEDLLVKLQEIASSTWGTSNSTTPTSSENHGASTEAANQVDSGSSFPAAAPNSSDEAARFQAMLGRLQGNNQSPPLVHDASVPMQFSCPPEDPAIIAVKVGDVKAQPAARNANGLYKAAANTFFAQRLNEMRTAKHQSSSSGDSGYVSKDKGKSPVRPSNVPYPETKSPSLNPAAVEFKSTATDDGAQWPSPKKLSRQPLTNIFPDAMARQPQRAGVPTAAGPAGSGKNPLAKPWIPTSKRAAVPVCAEPGKNPLAKPWIPTSQRAAVPVCAEPGKNPLAKPWFPALQRAPFPSELPQGNSLPQHMLPSLGMAATMPASALAGSPMLTTLGGLPPAAANFASPLNIGQMGFPVINGYHTFPPAPGSLPMPVFSQTHAPMFATTGLQPPQQQQAQQQPLPVPRGGSRNASASGTGNKPVRPYFPVTAKPRDRDPVKQQMYEAYLEWRKANEPGYHMKCKIRQAQRVVRQHQQQAQAQQQKKVQQGQNQQEDGDKSAGAGDSAA